VSTLWDKLGGQAERGGSSYRLKVAQPEAHRDFDARGDGYAGEARRLKRPALDGVHGG
jgi:hypothetical protein